MKRFRKIYLEISNICNLSCAFCPGTARKKQAMTREAFTFLLEKLRPWTDYLYFHLMGEPLCHPLLGDFLALAGEAGFRVILTTNGTRTSQWQQVLLRSPALHKLNISLHAFEANQLDIPFDDYLRQNISFAREARGRTLVVFRLWNRGGAHSCNRRILEDLEAAFPRPWVTEPRGTRIGHRVYLESGETFRWPDLEAEDAGERLFCYGLRDQLGVLCDGTVVPCCLDHEGDIPLGNLFTQSMEDILSSPRAMALYSGFSGRTAVEPLCRTCGYARRFQRT